MTPEPTPSVNNEPATKPTSTDSHPILARVAVPGWKTTEFWIAVALILLQVAGAVSNILPPECAAVLATITGIAYKALRTWLKVEAAGITPDTLFQLATSALASNSGPDSSGQAKQNSSVQSPAAQIVPATILLLLLPALAFSGCASSNATLAKFNAVAVPRAEQDIAAAIGGSSGAIAAQLTSSLQSNGQIDPSVLGSAAAVGALSALLKLDVSRASEPQARVQRRSNQRIAKRLLNPLPIHFRNEPQRAFYIRGDEASTPLPVAIVSTSPAP